MLHDCYMTVTWPARRHCAHVTNASDSTTRAAQPHHPLGGGNPTRLQESDSESFYLSGGDTPRESAPPPQRGHGRGHAANGGHVAQRGTAGGVDGADTSWQES